MQREEEEERGEGVLGESGTFFCQALFLPAIIDALPTSKKPACIHFSVAEEEGDRQERPPDLPSTPVVRRRRDPGDDSELKEMLEMLTAAEEEMGEGDERDILVRGE